MPVKRQRGRPRKVPIDSQPAAPRPAKKSARDEQQPSTSRAYQEPSNQNDFTSIPNPQMHSTLLSPQKSIDANSSMDVDENNDHIPKRMHKRAQEVCVF